MKSIIKLEVTLISIAIVASVLKQFQIPYTGLFIITSMVCLVLLYIFFAFISFRNFKESKSASIINFLLYILGAINIMAIANILMRFATDPQQTYSLLYIYLFIAAITLINSSIKTPEDKELIWCKTKSAYIRIAIMCALLILTQLLYV